MLAVASRLDPAPDGHGTHEQLGLQPCVWLMVSGYPCPTCGMTTACAHAANADLLASFHAQPLGMAIALVAAAGFWIGLHTGVTGSVAGRFTGPLFSQRGAILGVGALLAAWVYKLLTHGG